MAEPFRDRLCTTQSKPRPNPPQDIGGGLVLIACEKRQMPHHSEQEIAENAPPLGQLKVFLMKLHKAAELNFTLNFKKASFRDSSPVN